MIRIGWLAGMVWLASAVAALAAASTTVQPVTLRTLKKIPARELERYFDAPTWAALLDSPLAGYVVLRGVVVDGGKVSVTKVLESYPDQARSEFARELGERARVSGSTAGTHIRPTAEVFVLFYDGKGDDRHALIFAHPKSSVMDNESTTPSRERPSGRDFLEIVDFKAAPAGKGR